jgi:hypothetical protein
MIGVNGYAAAMRRRGAFDVPAARVGLVMLGHGSRPPLGYAGCGCRGYGSASCGCGRGLGAAELAPTTPVAPSSSSSDFSLYATAAGAALKQLTEGSADESVEVLKAKIKNQKRMMRSFPEPIKTLYRNNIATLEAKLRAAKRAKVEEAATTQSKREFVQLGQAGVVAGLLVGGALILFLVSRSAR